MREAQVPGSLSEPAFSGVLDRTQWALYTFVRGLVGEDELARDVVQDAFCDAWRAARRLALPFTDAGDEDDMRRWLFHAAYCRAVSTLRRRRLLRWIPLEAVSEPDIQRPVAPEPFEDQVAESAVVRAALARLTPEDAACLLLHVIEGFSSAEIAPIVGIKAEAAKKRLTRAKERLRAAYFAEDA
jgi:RNA polymerase sigma-70 factor (ECF subfamily)